MGELNMGNVYVATETEEIRLCEVLSDFAVAGFNLPQIILRQEVGNLSNASRYIKVTKIDFNNLDKNDDIQFLRCIRAFTTLRECELKHLYSYYSKNLAGKCYSCDTLPGYQELSSDDGCRYGCGAGEECKFDTLKNLNSVKFEKKPEEPQHAYYRFIRIPK